MCKAVNPGKGGQKADRNVCPTVEQTFLSAQSSVEDLLSVPRRIHMLGIGGIGMAGLAFLLSERGHAVSGSDLQENRQTGWLRAKGIRVLDEVPDGTEWIIRTTAVPDSHPEVVRAAVPVHRRGEVLPVLLRDRFTVAVSGTHGKTTTTAMIAQILDCGYCIGGEVQGFDGVARDGSIMAVEADESDGTVALYHPDIAVITNIEYDHMEHHKSAGSFEECFRRFAAQTKEKIVYCADDPAATRLCKDNPKAESYGFRDAGCGVRVSLPGRHNQLNAMAAMCVCRKWKTDAQIATALSGLRPVRRRFERVVEGDLSVISDYAHHPTEIRVLIQTALETVKPARLLAVFQPHRYTRTKALLNDFPPAFRGVDKLWLVPVYAASEEPLAGGTTGDLLAAFPTLEKPDVKKVQSTEAAWQDIKRELHTGDLLLIVGAGDIVEMEQWVKNEICTL
jgi:UDP-N-acetylmuramate--alanine ligase